MTNPFSFQALLGDLSLEEKAALCSGASSWTTQAIERMNIRAIRLSDGPHGLRRQPQGADHLGLYQSEPATCFPTAAALGSSWNPKLLERIGQALGVEARAADVQVLLGPGINIKRSPLCGRNFEYFSEDPHLSGVLGAAWVRGVQSQGVGASLKHFAANNQETDRMRVDVQADERTLREIYLSAFEHVVREARPWTVMAAYNQVNGEHACDNTWLLSKVLREEWGFDGLVMSDWGAISELPSCIAAGTDLEMPGTQGLGPRAVVDAVLGGKLSMESLDRAVTKLLQLIERTLPARVVPGRVDFAAHQALAREAAVESAVLLKNEGGLLPLDPGAALRVAVIGEFARTPRYQGEGSSRVQPTELDSALAALNAGAGPALKIEFAPGFTLDGEAIDSALHDEALALAARSDVVLLFLGLPATEESEGFDRVHIELPLVQRQLLHGLATVQTAIAVVLSNGAVVQTADWDAHARAILEVWLPGQAGGGAIADLVFGKANPSGRLAETVPRQLEDTPAFLNFPGTASVVRYGEGIYVGYRGYDKRRQAVAYPFGHGLSYTRFTYGDLSVQVRGAGDQVLVDVQASVRNAGQRAGGEVVQLYVRDPVAAIDRPLRELKGFAKVHLEAGEATTVRFTLNARDLSYFSPAHGRWVLEGGAFEIAVGASSRDLRLTAVVEVEAALPPIVLTAQHTILEWMAHPRGGPILQHLLAQSAGAQSPTDAAAMLRMIEGMPLTKLVAVSGGQLTLAHVDHMVAAANA